MNRSKIEDTLLKIGVPAGIFGFKYIADAIEIFDERGTNIRITRELYPTVAEKNNTTSQRAERSIRHALGVARKKGDVELVSKYIGTANTNNSSSLRQLYMMLKREEPEG